MAHAIKENKHDILDDRQSKYWIIQFFYDAADAVRTICTKEKFSEDDAAMLEQQRMRKQMNI